APPNPGPAGTRANEYFDTWGDRLVAAYMPGRAVIERYEVQGAQELETVVPTVDREAGKLAVIRPVRILPQTEATFTVRYRVPVAAVRGPDGIWTYTLVRQRQARMDPDMVTVVLTLPKGARPIDTTGW